MEELSIEQKARRYDEAIGMINKCTTDKYGCIIGIKPTDLFPELKENEDERVRTWLIEMVEVLRKANPTNADHNGMCSEAKAWLERQGECHISYDDEIMIKQLTEYFTTGEGLQNTNDTVVEWLIDVKRKLEKQGGQKVEPKFYEGEWVVFNNHHDSVYQVEKIENYEYILRHFLGGSIPLSFSHEDMIMAWTIQDAKNGDVLAAHDCIVLFKEIDGLNIKCHCTYHFMNNPSFYVNTLQNKSAFNPATKEQCDLLFQKMKETGYKWDVEKLELKEIDNEEVNGEDYGIDSLWHAQRILKKTLGSVDGYQTDDGILEHKCAISAVKKLYEQNPAWSEDDERNLQGIIDEIEANKSDAPDYDLATYDRFLSWLKFLKDRVRVQPQNKWKPSDEQMYILNWVSNILLNQDSLVEQNVSNKLQTLYNDLKKLM